MSDFKVTYRCGWLEMERWKVPSEWPVVEMEEECAELQGILVSRHCSSIKSRDGLAWLPNPKGIYTMASGYRELVK